LTGEIKTLYSAPLVEQAAPWSRGLKGIEETNVSSFIHATAHRAPRGSVALVRAAAAMPRGCTVAGAQVDDLAHVKGPSDPGEGSA
jgi:hypothetical protein